MRNIKLTIEYDGTAYCGWQIQPNGMTVQAVLKRAIEKMAGHPVTLTGASRTDAGVHALGQVANFKTEKKISCDGFLKGLNSMLPEDIAIKKVEEVPDDFHAKRSACGKHYRYLVAFGGSRPALLRNRVWYVGTQYVAQDFSPANISRGGVPSPPQNRKPAEEGLPYKAVRYDIVKKLNTAAQSLVGTHDFSAFCGSGDCNRSKVREIYSIEARVIPSESEGARARSCHPRGIRHSRDSGNPVFLNAWDSHFRGNDILLAIDIKGNGFLKYMVRNIVGTLIRPRKGLNSKLQPDPKICKILEGRDRRKAGVTAPACGLYLVEVFY